MSEHDMSAPALTAEALRAMKFRGPVKFYDGRNGWARQDFVCVDLPRFAYAWQRENRSDKGRQWYMVDGDEVATLEEAAERLKLPPNPNSRAEIERPEIDDFKFAPQLEYGASRAGNVAWCNASAGPFATLHSMMDRAENAWHRGINQFSDAERQAGREFPHWLYTVKSGAHELSRAMILFDMERKKDEGLRCALGVTCRECPILRTIEQAMIAARSDKWPSHNDDADIDGAKAFTCVGHILSSQGNPVDGVYFSRKEDRDNPQTY